MAISWIDDTVSAGARVSKACAELGISCRTLRRWRQAESLVDGRKQAVRPMSPRQLTPQEREEILDVCNQPEFQSLPPSQIVPCLADRGQYLASESSFYRVLKAHDQVNRRGRAHPPRNVPKPQPLGVSAPNRGWTWDITYLPGTVRGQFYRLYMIVDIYSRMIVGWEVHHEELAQHAAELIQKACLRQQVRRDQLVLHADNGSPMKGATMLATLQRLGVVPSFSRPSVSDDNPYSEALFRTLKYTPAYPRRPFASLDQARAWVHQFVTWYNHEHRHSAIRFLTPAQRHAQRDPEILAARHAVYLAARQSKPARWNGRDTRNWEPVGTVWLNPVRDEVKTPSTVKIAA